MNRIGNVKGLSRIKVYKVHPKNIGDLWLSKNIPESITFELVSYLPVIISNMLKSYKKSSGMVIEECTKVSEDLDEVISLLDLMGDEDVEVNTQIVFEKLSRILPYLWY
ncbi:MAG: hypothetical protein ACRCZ0_08215 [Cetobacterium sp.]